MTTTHTTHPGRFHHTPVLPDQVTPITVWVAEFDAMIGEEPMVTDVYRTRAQAVAQVADDIAIALESYDEADRPALEEWHEHCDDCGVSVYSSWTTDDGQGKWAVYPKTV